MAEYTPLNDQDTKELRKELKLPVTKELIYWSREGRSFKQLKVSDYEIIETYQPSNSKCMLITLETGKQVRILSDYLSEMQKPSFLDDMEEDSQKKGISGRCGERVETSPDTYVVVDLETTGTNHFSDSIIEIGAVKYVDGIETAEFDVLVHTETKIPAKIEELTGITDAMLSESGIPLEEACEGLRKFAGNEIVVGHNFAAFDSKFLEDAYAKELKCHFPNDYIDTLYLAKESLPDEQRYSMQGLSEKYGIDYSGAHRAAEDCRINHQLYEILKGGKAACGEAADESEFVEADVSEGWRARLTAMFPALEEELHLTGHALSIMENPGKDRQISSYAVCVYEPDLVEDRKNGSRNTVLARVRERVLKSNPDIMAVDSKNPGAGKYGETSKDVNGRFSVRLDKNSEKLTECLADCIRYGIRNYVPKAAAFACCARYQECSAEKKCIHPNTLYAKACEYRKNLESGHIFY